MNKNENRDALISEGKQNIVSFIKNKVFDFIGGAILVALSALMLNVLEGRPFTMETLTQVLAELLPFYICAMLLSLNYYKKGSYNGKSTQKFLDVVERYSDITDALTGNEIRYLREYCKEYNDEELKNLQIAILSVEGIKYEDFIEFRKLGYWKLRKTKGKLFAKAIHNAKKVSVSGINSNILLGNRKSADGTDLGPSESQMLAGRGLWYGAGYIFTIGFFVFLTVKNITQWDWKELLFELAKVIYIFVRSYMRYFEGYEDITIKLANSINRKADILKSYRAWFKENKPDKVDEEPLEE